MSTPLNPVIRKFIPPADLLERPRSIPKNFTISPAIRNLLSQPTWSVRSLLPPDYQNYESGTKRTEAADSSITTDHTTTNIDEEITPSKLHHLLRLSALPPPSSPIKEAQLIHALQTHIHFVRAIQSIPTDSVPPLVTISDESEEGIAESTITLADLEPYLALEEKVGRNGTIRRRGKIDLDSMDLKDAVRERKDWWIDVWRLGLGRDQRKIGNMFFVKKRPRNNNSQKNTADADTAVAMDFKPFTNNDSQTDTTNPDRGTDMDTEVVTDSKSLMNNSSQSDVTDTNTNIDSDTAVTTDYKPFNSNSSTRIP